MSKTTTKPLAAAAGAPWHPLALQLAQEHPDWVAGQVALRLHSTGHPGITAQQVGQLLKDHGLD